MIPVAVSIYLVDGIRTNLIWVFPLASMARSFQLSLN